jgi:hypothetical protein
LFLTSSITRKNIVNMDANDVYAPVDILLMRPYMTYSVSSAIAMKAGRETGETYIGDQKFEMTSNISDRTMYGNYFYYGKAVVKKPRNVMVAPSIFIQNYIKGNNTSFINRDNLDMIRDESGLLEASESILAFMVRVDDPVDTVNIIDIRGWHAGLKSIPNQEHEVHPYLYSTAPYYRKLLNINISGLADPSGTFIDYEDVSMRANSICFLGHTEDSDGRVLYRNTGHLGSITYDGVEKSRKPGMYSPIRQMNHH